MHQILREDRQYKLLANVQKADMIQVSNRKTVRVKSRSWRGRIFFSLQVPLRETISIMKSAIKRKESYYNATNSPCEIVQEDKMTPGQEQTVQSALMSNGTRMRLSGRVPFFQTRITYRLELKVMSINTTLVNSCKCRCSGSLVTSRTD